MCLVEISSVVKVVLLAICFLVFAFCLVGCNLRWDLSLSDNDSGPFGTYHQVQLLIYLSSVFPQSGFRLHLSFAEIFSQTEVVFIVMLHTVIVQKAFFRNSPVRWPFVVVYNIFLTFKRHNCTDQLVSWLCTSDIRRQTPTRYLLWKKSSLFAVLF